MARIGSGQRWPGRAKHNGEICVDLQSFTIGRQHAHQLVEVHVTDRLLEVWVEGNLVKQVQRRRHGPVRKRRASKPWVPRR